MQHYQDRNVIQGRCAHLTKRKCKYNIEQGRINARQEIYVKRVVRLVDISVLILLLFRGQQKQAILTFRPDSVVHSIIYDDKKKKQLVCG